MPDEPLLDPLDQPQWEALTTWPSEQLPAGEAWTLLASSDLAPSFRAAVAGSQHAFVRRLRDTPSSAVRAGTTVEPLIRRQRWNNRFANLVSGRFTEVVFSRAYAPAIAAIGLKLRATVQQRDWKDFVIETDADGFQLAVNVKNAGVQFRDAERFVGMAAEETLPIATYKIFGSSAREDQLPLVYVYLVDWTLLGRLRAAYWTSLSGAERRVFQMATSFRGMPRDLEDCFIEATVADRVEALGERVGYDPSALDRLPFRAISGARCKAIFYRDHKRSPYVFLQRMNTDPNVHVSVSEETLHFRDFVRDWLSSPERRSKLLTGLRRTATMPVPDPPV